MTRDPWLDYSTSDLLMAYSKDPIAKYAMEVFDISQTQSNTVCGDEVTVYLKIIEWKMVERSRDGSIEMQTTAAASMLWEVIQWEDIQTILTRDYEYIKNLWLELSPRRRRSGVTALLATRNAIHQWLGDELKEWYEDIL